MASAINSILNQSYNDFEFIIVNDNPQRKDNELFLNEFARRDNRIKILTNTVNLGLTKSLNIALKQAIGEYIARMDADDISDQYRFEKQIDFLDKNQEIGVCGSYIKTFGAAESEIKYPLKHSDCFIFFESPFAHPAVMMRKRILLQNNISYNEALRYSQDYDLWERLYPITKFANIPEFLLNYRINAHQITRVRHAEQYAISTAIKFRAFNTYCQYNGIKYQLTSPIDLRSIKDYKKNIPLSVKFNRNLFMSYIYRSIRKGKINSLIYLLLSGDFIKLGGIENSIKTIVTLAILKKKQPFLME